MQRHYVSLLAAFFLIAKFAPPQINPCTETQQRKGEYESDRLRSWDALHRSYRLYGHCDNAMAGEGYSESIARILVDHWQTLPRLSRLIAQDKEFKRFVHLDATMETKDLELVREKARRHCPADLKQLCERLKNEADAAIKEQAGVTKKP